MKCLPWCAVLCCAMLCYALICYAVHGSKCKGLHVGDRGCWKLHEWRLQQCCCRHAHMMKPAHRPLAGTSKMHKPEHFLIHFLSCVLGKLTTGLQAVSIVLCWQRTIRIGDECNRRNDLSRVRTGHRRLAYTGNKKTKCMLTVCTISALNINAIVTDLLQLLLVKFWIQNVCSIACHRIHIFLW